MKQHTPLAVGLALASAAGAEAQSFSPWLPQANQLVATPAYTFQTFDEFWAGETKVRIDDPQRQHTAMLGMEYGLCDSLAADLTLGYSWVESPSLGGNDDGLADTSFGVRWRFLDETKVSSPYAPTLGLRVGGIVKGTYDENFPFSVGDGASGFETSLLFGKQVCTGFGLYGDFGYRIRTHDVPEDLFGSAGVYAKWNIATLSVGYRHVQGLSGPDIGDPGFGTEFGFPQVKEINQNIEVALGITGKDGMYFQFFYAHTLDGRNTGIKDVFGFSVNIPMAIGGK